MSRVIDAPRDRYRPRSGQPYRDALPPPAPADVPRDANVWRDLAVILFGTILINIVLIAVPGFFSHDELAWVRYIRDDPSSWGMGLDNVFESAQFRPLGAYLVALGLRFPDQPFGAHFFMVLVQALGGWALYFCVRQFWASRAVAAALLFAAMPMAAFSVGWIGAIYDVSFVLFGLVCIGAGVKFWRGGAWYWACLSVLGFAAAMLCKEAALGVPLLALGLAWLDRDRANWRRVIVLGVGVTLFCIAYAVFRLSAIWGTVSTPGGYGFGGLGGIARHAAAYFGFPYAWSLGEIIGYEDRDLSYKIQTIAPHLVLVGLVGWRFGIAAVLAYLAAFFVPLGPVLIITEYSTQYVYASSVAMAVAFAFLFGRSLFYVLVPTVLLIPLLLHTAIIQDNMYRTGLCQTTLRNYGLALRNTFPPDAQLKLYTPPETTSWMAARGFFQDPANIEVTDDPSGAQLELKPDCSVILRQPQ